LARLEFSRYGKVYRLLLSTYGRDWHVQVSFALALVSRACRFVGLPVATSLLIASLAEQDYGRARTLVLIYVAISATFAVLTPLTRYIALLGENKVYASMMTKYFHSLMNRDMKYFNESMTGYITTAARQYSDNSINMVRKIRERYLTTVFSILVPIFVIAYVDTALGAIVFMLSGIQAIYLLWASHKITPYRTKSREIYKRISGLISDAVINIVAIKSTAQEEEISNRVGTGMKEETSAFIARYKAQVRIIAVREIITVLFFLVLFWVTVDRLSSGTLEVAGAVLVITYVMTIMTAIYDLTESLDEHDDFVDKILPSFEMLEEPNVIFDPDHPIKFGNIKGDIKFKDVHFSYVEGNGNVDVFNGLDLRIPAGQKIGIVGLSGAGKSTLAKLLLRFEDVQKGVISIDDISVRSVKQTDLRKNIAYVPQEPLLFHSSVAENIRLAKLDATDGEVRSAATSAYANHFIEALPDGYGSIVGERGVKLSGGQKQRIAIARAVLQDAPILLFDEATSALDSESEQIIKESFSTIFKDKTAIVIAHRLSTLADMDRIVLLHGGIIIEDGTQTELLKKDGVYAKLWHRQRLHPEELETMDSLLEGNLLIKTG
jgi:ATP-binding cassette subfamily B protein